MYVLVLVGELSLQIHLGQCYAIVLSSCKEQPLRTSFMSTVLGVSTMLISVINPSTCIISLSERYSESLAKPASFDLYHLLISPVLIPLCS